MPTNEERIKKHPERISVSLVKKLSFLSINNLKIQEIRRIIPKKSIDSYEQINIKDENNKNPLCILEIFFFKIIEILRATNPYAVLNSPTAKKPDLKYVTEKANTSNQKIGVLN